MGPYKFPTRWVRVSKMVSVERRAPPRPDGRPDCFQDEHTSDGVQGWRKAHNRPHGTGIATAERHCLYLVLGKTKKGVLMRPRRTRFLHSKSYSTVLCLYSPCQFQGWTNAEENDGFKHHAIASGRDVRCCPCGVMVTTPGGKSGEIASLFHIRLGLAGDGDSTSSKGASGVLPPFTLYSKLFHGLSARLCLRLPPTQ